MLPYLALGLCYCLVSWLIFKDMKWREAGSWALLIPGLLLAVRGSRPLSFWLDAQTAQSYLEGNLVDTLFFLTLVVSAIIVLFRRQVSWGLFLGENRALILIYVYFA